MIRPGSTEPLPNGYRPRGVLDFRILGPLEVVGEEGPIRLGGPKQRAALAILLLNANRVVSVERLADELYAGRPPATAVTQVQRQISELRTVLGSSSRIDTRAPGYVIHVSPDQLDLTRFEQRVSDAASVSVHGDAHAAGELLRDALGLWRGGALADLGDEPFAALPIRRLEELRQVALERRLEADLALGRHAELIGELQELVAEQPLRETLSGLLMIALYRSGRQAEALAVYRQLRRVLVEQFGIEPTPVLQQLERAILTHEASLGLASTNEAVRSVLVLPSAEGRLDDLLSVARALAMPPSRELIVLRLLGSDKEIAGAVDEIDSRLAALGVPGRAAAFTTDDPAVDATRFAASYDVELVLLDERPGMDGDALPDELSALLERSPADVAVRAGRAMEWGEDAVIVVPFGGGEHDWAALELAAWLALGTAASLRLLGTKADPRLARRDASRLLADASLAVQRAVGILAEPLLVEANEEALLAAAGAAVLVVVGVSPRWRGEGIGTTRRALVREGVPMLLVHRGPRPGGLSPRTSGTRFTWSLEG